MHFKVILYKNSEINLKYKKKSKIKFMVSRD